MKNNKKGMALVLALAFAVVLLQLAISFSGMTKQSKPQTVQIDERVKLDYLAQGLTELALLKFQLFPADYYACWDAAKLGQKGPLNDFTIKAPEFTMTNFTGSNSSFNNAGINIQLASMSLYTENKWQTEALLIQAYANYTDQYGKLIQKDAVKIVSVERILKK